MTPFDPYYQWLGIRDTQRPPNHYRLLGLDLFEDDLQVIATAADRQMTHLRTFQNGPRSGESQRLLNEVSEARVCLLDRTKKAAYDATLKAQIEPPSESGVEVPRIRIQTPPGDPLQLNRPGRGNRDRVPLNWVLAATAVVLLFSVGTFYYRYRKDHPVATADRSAVNEGTASSGTTQAKPSENAADTAGEADGDSISSSDPPSNAGSKEDASDSAKPADGVGESEGAASTDRDASPSENVGDSDNHVTPDDRVAESSKPPVKETAEGSATSPQEREQQSKPEESESAASEASNGASKLPPLDWNPSDYEIAAQPLKIAPEARLAVFLLQMRERRLDEMRKTMTGWLKAKSSPLDANSEAELQLMFDTLDQFWSAVDSQLASLKAGDALQFRSWTVKVAQRNAQVLVLESATGKKHPFEVARGAMHRDVAIGLVERQFRESPGTAYRLIGVFLLLDRDGNQTMAQDYFRRAEELGFPAGFLEEVIRRTASPFG